MRCPPVGMPAHPARAAASRQRSSHPRGPSRQPRRVMAPHRRGGEWRRCPGRRRRDRSRSGPPGPRPCPRRPASRPRACAGPTSGAACRRRTEAAVAGARGSSGPAIAARKPRGGGLTDCPRSRDRDRRHATQAHRRDGGAGRHDFPVGWRDDGRDALSVPSPRPAGRRGSRGPEPVDNAVGRAAAGLAVGLAATGGRVDGRGGHAPTFGVTPPPPAAAARRAMAAAPSAPSWRGKRGQQVRRWLERRGRRAVHPQPRSPPPPRSSGSPFIREVPKKGLPRRPLPVYADRNSTHRIAAHTGVTGVRLPRPQGRLLCVPVFLYVYSNRLHA